MFIAMLQENAYLMRINYLFVLFWFVISHSGSLFSSLLFLWLEFSDTYNYKLIIEL